MRIGVTGSHCTGKSTLAKEIAEHYKLPLIEETAREAHQLGFGLDTGTSFPSQMAIWLLQLQHEARLGYRGYGFVSDRTIFDPLAYSASNPQCFSVPEQKALDILYQTVKVMAGTRNPYDVVFYCPILWPLEADGVRAGGDTAYQHAIDDAFLDIYVDLGYTIVPVPMKGRMEFVKNYIEAYIA